MWDIPGFLDYLEGNKGISDSFTPSQFTKGALEFFLGAGLLQLDYNPTTDKVRLLFWATDGKQNTQEANSSTISANTLLTVQASQSARPVQGDPLVTDDRLKKGQPKWAGVELTLIGGATAAFTLVTALPGYYSALEIAGITSSVTDGNGEVSFECPPATPARPGSVFVNAYTASVRNLDLAGLRISHNTALDNQAIAIVLAGFGAGAGTVYVEFLYWWET